MFARSLLIAFVMSFFLSSAGAETPGEQLGRVGQQFGIDSVIGDQPDAMRAHVIDGLSGRWLQSANLFLGKQEEALRPDVFAKACRKFGGELVADELQIRAERPYTVDGATRAVTTVFTYVTGSLYTRYVDPLSVFDRLGVSVTDPARQKTRDQTLRFLTGDVEILRPAPDVLAILPVGGTAELWIRCP